MLKILLCIIEHIFIVYISNLKKLSHINKYRSETYILDTHII